MPTTQSIGNVDNGAPDIFHKAGNAIDDKTSKLFSKKPKNATDPNNNKSKVKADVNNSTDDIDGFPRLRLVVDGNTDVFRYGLQPINPDSDNDSTNAAAQYEDPTILGFTMEIDEENSPLFVQLPAFLQKYSVNNSELRARQGIYADLIKLIRQIFKSQESSIDPTTKDIFIKSHYINSVAGMALLNKKFIKYMEDKISLELYEDINMTSTALATLYNNLIFSYDSGRHLIPMNLTKFILRIKISEIRNFTSLAGFLSKNSKDVTLANNLKFKMASMTYTLYDCDFDFIASQPFQDTIKQNGIEVQVPGFSSIPLNIYFKSVSRSFRSPNLLNYIMTDNNIQLTNQNNVTGFGGVADKRASAYITQFMDKEPSNTNINDNGVIMRQTEEYVLENAVDNPPNYSNLNDKNKSWLDNVKTLESKSEKIVGSKVSNKVKGFANDKLNTVENALRRKRADLLNNFISQANTTFGLRPPIVPDNVYKQYDYRSDVQKELKNITGLEIEKGFLDTINPI